jgi:proline iminopeptidase
MSSGTRTDLYYRIFGNGTPMLMLHSGLGVDHACFPPFFDGLGDRLTLVYFDQRGNGSSPIPAAWEKVTFASLAADADTLRAALGYEKIILFGHGVGGLVAQQYAARYPDTLHGLVLCATAANPAACRPHLPAWATAEQIEAFLTLVSRPLRDDAEWKRLWTTVWPFYFHQYDAAIAQALHARTRYRAAAWNHGQRLLPGFDSRSLLPQVHVPTLVMAGRHDIWMGPEAAGVLQQALPNADCVIFEASSHYPFIEEPQRFRRILQQWLHKL